MLYIIHKNPQNREYNPVTNDINFVTFLVKIVAHFVGETYFFAVKTIFMLYYQNLKKLFEKISCIY